jgi:hypothetical protein
MTDIKAQLDALAGEMLEACSRRDAAPEQTVSFDTKVDVFKAVAQYYLGCSKAKPKKDDPSEGKTFENLVKGLKQGTHEGGTA